MEQEDNNNKNEIEEEKEEEEDSEEQSSTGSPTAAGFVHVDPNNNSSSPSSSPTNSINQDDGVVVTRVDDVQNETRDLMMTEDGGNEEFVDCPDDLVSYDGRTDFDESSEAEIPPEGQQTFGDVTQDIRHILLTNEREILPNHYQEERRQLMTELTNLRHQLKDLIKKPQLIDRSDGGLFTGELKSASPLHEIINECSSFIELASSEQSEKEGTIRDLSATLDTKDREINDLNVKVIELSSVETIADRIRSIFATVFGEEEFPATSVSDKLSHLEKNTSIIIEYYNRFLLEAQMLNQCLTEVKSDYQIEADLGKVFFIAREELVSLKRKEYELAHKSSLLEVEYGKLMEQLGKSRETIEMLNSEIGKLNGEVELQKTRAANIKEKLNLAVTKGKSLVQQRDSLKQVIVEKTNELDKCLAELQERSTSLEAVNSLKEALLQRDVVLKKCEDILSFSGVGEQLPSSDIADRVTWLANESIRLHDEIDRTKEAAHAEIDRLTVSLVVEAQEKNYLSEDRLELNKCSNKIANLSEELRVLKDQNGSLQVDLQRSEDKAALLREKLSMAVKKGKGLVQERDSLKQQMAENNAQIEELKTELIHQEERDVGRIAKLESDLQRLIEEKDQVEEFLTESNTILQRVIEATDEIAIPIDVTDPVGKVKWCVTYLNECQVAKMKAEQELGDEKDKAGKLASQLQQVIKATDEIAIPVDVTELVEKVKWCATYLNECQAAKVKAEQELGDVKDEAGKLASQLQQVIAAIDEVVVPADVTEPVERVKWCATYIHECQFAKAKVEQELGDVKDEAGKLASKLTDVMTAMKSLEDASLVSEQHVAQLTKEKRELEAVNTNNEEELQKAMEEVSTHAINLNESHKTIKSLEDALSVSEQHVSQLNEEKRDFEISKTKTEEELQKAKEEVSTNAIKLSEAYKTIKSLEDALSISEQRVTQLTEEKMELEVMKTNTKEELRKAMDEVSTHAINLKEAYKTIKSLEDAKSRLQTHVSQFSNVNEKALDDRSLLENEIKKLKEEAASHEHKLLDASARIKSLKDEALKAENTISDLVGEKKNAEQEISNLNAQLSACSQELASKHEDISSFLDNLQARLKDGTLLTLFKQRFDKNVEIFREMDHHIRDIKDYLNLEQLQDWPAIEENYQMSTLIPAGFDNVLNTETTDENAAAAKEIGSYAGRSLENLKMRNQILADEFGRISTFIDELTTTLSRKLVAIKNTVPVMVEQTKSLHENVTNLQIGKQAQEKRVEMLEHDIKELQNELEKTRSMYDKAKEENNILQSRVLKLEVELDASQNLREEMSIKLDDKLAKEDEWNKREAELSKQIAALMKDREAENDLLSASEVKSLYHKIKGIAIPFPNIGEGETEAHDSDPSKKLFYIVENVNELLDQITMLSDSKEELHSTLSKQALEIERLKDEFKEANNDKKEIEKMKNEILELSTRLERIITTFGGDESIGGKKSADMAGLVWVLERLIHDIVLDSENSKVKAQDISERLLETEKVAEELASKVKLLEDVNQKRASLPDTIHERGGTESSSLPPRSEISEVEDPGSVGKRATPLVPSAAQMRSLRKGSDDHLSINIDPESDSLVDKHETVEDKGHKFKSLHTSGLVPAKGKIIADRLDGIWVSGGRALMSRPRARLGLIAYWLVLHLWLLGTLL
nr:hypothetical protein [Tanacetum cinerariifolium]